MEKHLIFYNLINYIFLLTIIIFFIDSIKLKISLILTSASPFLLFVIFPHDLWPDQIQYFTGVADIRRLDFSFNTWIITLNSYFLSIVPIPFITNIISVGLINKLLFIIVVFYIYKKKLLPVNYLIILIFLPSSILLSTLALKDMLIFFFMFFSFYYFLQKQYLLSFILILVIYFLKFQNALFMIVLLINYYFLFEIKLSKIYKNLIILISLIVFLLFAQYIIDQINYYNKGLFFSSYNQDIIGSKTQSQYYYDNIEIKNLIDFCFKMLTRSFAFLTAPTYPIKTIHYLQFCENLIIFFLIYIIVLESINKKNYKLLFFWFVSLFIIFGIYGMAVYNYGTITRYRYPFILLFLIFIKMKMFKKTT